MQFRLRLIVSAGGVEFGLCIPEVSGTTLTQVAIAHFLSIGEYEYHLKTYARHYILNA